MFKAISRNTALATCLVLGVSYGANAQNVDPYEDYQFSCSSPSTFFDTSNSECESFEVVYLEDNLQELNSQPNQNEIAQTRRRRKTGKYYGGFTGGAFFSSGEVDLKLEEFNPDFKTAFGGSIFGGMKVNNFINAELELFLGFGGLNGDDFNNEVDRLVTANGGSSQDFDLELDGDYSAVALYFSPKFEFALSKSGRGATVFVSPGVGLSQTNVTTEIKTSGNPTTVNTFKNLLNNSTDPNDRDVAKALDEQVDASQTGISFQIKAGGTFPISRNISIIGQTRFATLPTEDDIDSIKLFSVEGGLNFKF
jgi:hypothetical protein